MRATEESVREKLGIICEVSWGTQGGVTCYPYLWHKGDLPVLSWVSAAGPLQPFSPSPMLLWARPALTLPGRGTIGNPCPRAAVKHSPGISSPCHWLVPEMQICCPQRSSASSASTLLLTAAALQRISANTSQFILQESSDSGKGIGNTRVQINKVITCFLETKPPVWSSLPHPPSFTAFQPRWAEIQFSWLETHCPFTS